MAVADAAKWMNCNLQREGEERAGGASEKRWNGSNEEEEMSGKRRGELHLPPTPPSPPSAILRR